MPRETSRKEKNIAVMQKSLDNIERMVMQNCQAISGHGTMLGLVGEVALLKEKIHSVETMLTNDMKHLAAKVDVMFERREMMDTTQAKFQLERDAGKMSKSEILSDWVKPVLVSIVTAILVYLIVTAGLAGGGC